MPDQFGRPTREELQQMAFAKAAREGKASMAGMENPYVTPEMQERAGKEFAGRERSIASRGASGRAMMAAPGPKGKTVGPSNIYVAPNWGEGLASGFSKGMGAYLQAKAAREGRELDVEKSDTKKAGLEVAAAQARQAADVRAEERSTDALAKVTAASVLEDNTMSRHRDDQAESQVTVKRADGTGKPMSGFRTQKGWNVDGKTFPAREWIEYEEPSSSGSYKSGTVKSPSYIFKPETGETLKVATMGDQTVTIGENGQWVPLGFNPSSEGWLQGSMSAERVQKHIGSVMKTAGTGNLRELVNSSEQMLGVLGKYDLSIDDLSEVLGQTGKAGGLSGKISRLVGDAAEEGKVITEQEIYSSIAQVLNDIIRAQAGMSQTVAEIGRVTEAYGNDLVSHPDVMEWALKRMMGRLDARVSDKRVEFGDQALSSYRRQTGGKTWLDTDFGGIDTTDADLQKEITTQKKKAAKLGIVVADQYKGDVVEEPAGPLTPSPGGLPGAAAMPRNPRRRGPPGSGLPRAVAPPPEPTADPYAGKTDKELEEMLRIRGLGG